MGIIFFGLGLLVLFTLGKLLLWPLRIIMNLLINGVVGGILLLIVNLVGGLIGLEIKINIINSLIAGIFGVPGVIFIIIWQLLF